MSDAPHRIDVSAEAWQAFAAATLIRDSLTLHGGGDVGGLRLTGDAHEAVLLGLDRLIELARSIATASAASLPPRYPVA